MSQLLLCYVFLVVVLISHYCMQYWHATIQDDWSNIIIIIIISFLLFYYVVIIVTDGNVLVNISLICMIVSQSASHLR